MISVPNIIKAWESRLCAYGDESITARLIRDTIVALKLLDAPLSEQDKADLDTMHRIRSGEIKKKVCHDYAIYNGDWYREHPWDIPQEPVEPVEQKGRRFKYFKCGNCCEQFPQGSKPIYCSNCGKAVKWE